MNKIKLYKRLYILTSLFIVISACKKDLGNYNYSDINEVSFINLDTVNGYEISIGDTLNIYPEFEATMDNGFSGDYSYEWRLVSGIDNFFTEDGKDQVLASTKNLNYLVTFKPGIYPIGLYVKDNKSGVTWMKSAKLKVISPFYEGWLVLNKVNNNSRLDFISYADDVFNLTTDLLTKLDAGVPEVGEPYQILYHRAQGFQGIQLLTSGGAVALEEENFKNLPAQEISKKMYGTPPSSFRATKYYSSVGEFSFYNNIFMYDNQGNIYKQGNGFWAYDLPLNTNAATSQVFNIAPWFSYSGGYNGKLLMYNKDEKKFFYVTKLSLLSYTAAFPVEEALNFPSGKELVYMSDNNVTPDVGTNYTYAILKDPGFNNFHMVRSSFVNDNIQPVDYYESISATDFAMAENFAISPDLGYLFYNVGGKVYEYDLFLKTSKLMIDKGNEKISLMVFEENPKPGQWKNSLMIGSYDPSGIQGENGTLTQYLVPPVNGTLVEQNQWTGLGEVVSISYRYR